MNKHKKYDLQPVNTPQVPKDFHLKLRQRFVKALTQENSHKQTFNKSACIFKGIPTVHRNYEDVDEVVDQQSTFWYLFGIKQADCYALIENGTGKTTIFIPHLPQQYKMWMYIKPQQLFQQDSQAEQVLFIEQMEQYIRNLELSEIYLYAGTDSDSGLDVALPQERYWGHIKNVNKQTLWILIANLRTIKTQDQIKLMRYVCKISSEAHVAALKSTKAGLKQGQMQCVFDFEHSTKCGHQRMAFHSICSSGQDCATLHYIENDKVYQPGQMALHDMGGKWYGYCADIAITFPVDGKFTQHQKAIYNAVYFAQKAVLDVLKPGVNWQDMHLLAERVIIQHLIQIGIINKYPMEQLVEKRVGAIFFPHGLGHFLGLRVHDIGGYTKGQKRQRSKLPGLKSLRTRRDMEEGMIITVQPGCYFVDFIIKNALESENAKYLNRQKIQQYQHVGGVRLQDDVLITKNGNQVLSCLPRTVEDLEKLLAQ